MSYAAKVFLWLREELFISGRLLGNSVRMVDYGRQQWKQQVCGFGLTEGGTDVEKKLDKKNQQNDSSTFCRFLMHFYYICNNSWLSILVQQFAYNCSTWYIRVSVNKLVASPLDGFGDKKIIINANILLVHQIAGKLPSCITTVT